MTYSKTVKYINMQHVGSFLFMHTFILIGFAFGLYSLFQLSPSLSSEFSTPWRTMFVAFNLWTGNGYPVDVSRTDDLESSISSSLWFVYIAYIGLAVTSIPYILLHVSVVLTLTLIHELRRL